MAQSIGKRLIVCCDGTWNDSDKTNQPPTNVTKLARSIAHTDPRSNHIRQITYYQSGIGTKSDTTIDHDFDGATGQGISDKVCEAYGFICNNFEAGDEIFLVGFSRGAFTARTISSLIHDVGLLSQHGLGYFVSIFRAWERQNLDDKGVNTDKLGTSEVSWAELRDKLLSSKLTRYPINIKACAVWDTVGSLGMPVGKSFLSSLGINAVDSIPSPYSFVNKAVCDNIEHAFHAIALDEHRAHFEPTIWEQPDGQKLPLTLRQCWFTGYHTHIGGGNNTNNMLPNIALAWMMTQLKDHLFIDYSHVKSDPEEDAIAESLHLEGEAHPDDGELTDSKSGWYLLDGFGTEGLRTPAQYCRTDPKTMATTTEPLQNTRETIHSSVRRRFWNRKFNPFDKVPYHSAALKDWDPASVAGKWVYAGDAEAGPRQKEIPEEPMSEYEADIYKSWDPNFKSIEDFDLQHTTH